MDTKNCFFIVHREASEEIYPALYAAVEQHNVEHSDTEFIAGHYGEFDRLVASAVKGAKRFHPLCYCHIIRQSDPSQHPLALMEHSIRQGWKAFCARLQL